MTNISDKNSQIRAKNLFEEDVPEEKSNREPAEEKNLQGVQNDAANMPETGAQSASGDGNEEEKPGSSDKKTASDKSTTEQSVTEKSAKNKTVTGKPTAGSSASKKKRENGKNTFAATRQSSSAGKRKKKAKKNPREKQAAYRLYVCIVMAVFVLFVMGWGVCQGVLAINRAEKQSSMIVQPGEQVVDNSANAGKSIDLDKFVNRMLDNVTFDAELNLLEDSVASGMIDTAEGTDLRIYMGNGTYSDELVVMTARSETDAEQNQKNAEAHLAEMQKQFNDYIPKEAKKIDKAVKVRCGCYVVVCVTNDTDTAKKTIDAFMKDSNP